MTSVQRARCGGPASDGLKLWATLLPYEITRVILDSHTGLRDDLEASGLALVDERASLVRRLPSWSLCALHPSFSFASPRRLPSVRALVDLWPGGEWSSAAFEAILSTKSTHSWWLLGQAISPAILANRVRRALPGILAARQFVVSQYPGASVRSIVLSGSYLWAAKPRKEIDIAVIADLGPAAPAVLHSPEVGLQGNQRWEVESQVVSTLDLLIVHTSAIDRPAALTGTIGDWLLPHENAMWYDTRTRTVLSAARQTFRACLTVCGEDFFPPETEDLEAMLSLAYYFTQEASQLLDWRHGISKAANRLWEANLILDRLDTLAGMSSTSGVVERSLNSSLAMRAASTLSGRDDRDVDAAMLAALQGWLAAEPTALLPKTIRRIVHARKRVARSPRAPDPAVTIRAVLARAHSEGWPTLYRLQGDTRELRPAEVATLLGDPWAAYLLGYVP